MQSLSPVLRLEQRVLDHCELRTLTSSRFSLASLAVIWDIRSNNVCSCMPRVSFALSWTFTQADKSYFSVGGSGATFPSDSDGRAGSF